MFTKIYSSIKKFIKENIIQILILLLIVFILRIPLPYYIEAPGGMINLKDKVIVKNGDVINGSYNITYISVYKGNVTTYILSKIHKSWDLIKNEEYLIDNDLDLRNKIMLQNAFSNAYYVSMKYLDKELNLNSSIVVVYIDKLSETNLKIGDEIISVDGNIVNSVDEIREYLKSKNVGDKIYFKLSNGDEKYAILKDNNGNKSIFIYLVCNYIYDKDIEYKFDSSESGSSGGLMMALSIYDQNTSFDLARGRIIAGTGTIELDGSVGEISGLKYKIMGIKDENIDVFFVPYPNYEEAKEIIKNNNYSINLVPVKNFSDAINYLKK